MIFKNVPTFKTKQKSSKEKEYLWWLLDIKASE